MALGERQAHKLAVAAETGVLLPVRLQLLLAVEVHVAVFALFVADAFVLLELLVAGKIDLAFAAHLHLRVLLQSGFKSEKGFAVVALEEQFPLVLGLLLHSVFGRVAVFDVLQQGVVAAQMNEALVAIVRLLALVGLQLRLSVKAHGAMSAPVGAVCKVLGLQRLLLQAQSDGFADVFAGRAELNILLVDHLAGASLFVLP